MPDDVRARGLSDGWAIAVPVRWPGLEGVDVLAGGGGARLATAWRSPSGDPAAFEVARIEAGVPAMGRELTEKTIPQEAGSLVEHTVSFTKGCYTGQELVARLEARGANVARRLRGVVLDPAGRVLQRMRFSSRANASSGVSPASPGRQGLLRPSPSPMCAATSCSRPWPGRCRAAPTRKFGNFRCRSDRQSPW